MPCRLRSCGAAGNNASLEALSFAMRVQIEIRKMPGDYEVVIEQRDGNRLSQHKTFIEVVTLDKRERRERN